MTFASADSASAIPTPFSPFESPSPSRQSHASHFEGKSKVIAITSGKGGVGKTFVAANLAAALAQRGRRVLVLDLDLGLANMDVVLNLYPRKTLHDVLSGVCPVEDVLVKVAAGFTVLPAGSGLSQYGRLTLELSKQLLDLVAHLAPKFDVVLLDTGAGLSDLLMFVLSLAQEVMVVATPEPTSLTDAYAVIKVLSVKQRRKKLRLLVNQITQVGEGKRVTSQLQAVTDRFLNSLKDTESMQLIHVGDIPADQTVKDAILQRQLLVAHYPHSPAGIGVMRLSGRLLETVLK